MSTIVAAAVRDEHVEVPAKPTKTVRRSKLLYIGLSLLGLLILFAVVSPLFGSPYVLHRDGLTDLGSPLGILSPGHLAGTDSLGRDLLARSASGLRATLVIAIAANVTSMLVGTVVGLIAGSFGPVVQQGLMRIVDVFLSIPIVLSGLALASIVGRGMWGIVVVVTALYWAWTARLVYGEVLRLRGRGFVEAAAVHGVGKLTILRRHILPHISTVLLNIAALNGAAVVVIGAGLSYLGAGIQPPQPELGNLLASGSTAIDYAPHLLLVPLVLTIATVLSFVLIAEGINRRNSLSERQSWLDI
ncbi:MULTISPECIES: ABC transporter permease [Rhodococcus]|uniref:Putative ABC transporter permease protein n=1 Tax=Rhodococcus wratislaviensis NBRC 100605 TaxID=1219028 RepID=X0QGS4_RHOWR|nr:MULTISPECIES: ABC transporter permease [Rhodococcus]WAM12065.1 ABC transporter permease [Rhodococcus sp. JS3073]GAF50071.1 putative ABC transporter permease protein [Rhodococcus wratislaviensis NBRC 100605]